MLRLLTISTLFLLICVNLVDGSEYDGHFTHEFSTYEYIDESSIYEYIAYHYDYHDDNHNDRLNARLTELIHEQDKVLYDMHYEDLEGPNVGPSWYVEYGRLLGYYDLYNIIQN